MEKGCFICGICEAGDCESGVRFCPCKGYIRYVVWGVLPTPKKRGPKPKIRIEDVLRKIVALPMSAKLYDVADALEVEERTVERVIAPYVKILREYLKEMGQFDPSHDGFELLHAVIKGKGKRKPRIPSSQYKKLLPD